MAYYVKVKPSVRDRILPKYITGTKAADGNIILFQSDLNSVDGLTLSDRASVVGGVLLTPQEAKQEIDGTCEHPAECYDPEEKKSDITPDEEEETPMEEIEESNNEEESEVNNG